MRASVRHRELCSLLCGHDLNGKEVQKTGDMCIHTDDSLCCAQNLTPHCKAAMDGVCACSAVSGSVTPGTVARQAPLPIGFSRCEYWSGLLFPYSRKNFRNRTGQRNDYFHTCYQCSSLGEKLSCLETAWLGHFGQESKTLRRVHRRQKDISKMLCGTLGVEGGGVHRQTDLYKKSFDPVEKSSW